jgi:hypothetical protein
MSSEVQHKRYRADERKLLLEKSAMEIAMKMGYRKVTRINIARHAGVSGTLIATHLGDMATVRSEILRQGCLSGNIKLIIEGLLADDPLARSASRLHRKKIIDFLFPESEN